MRLILSFWIVISLMLSACNSGEKMKPMSLLDYGIPLTILVPDSAKVRHRKLSLEEDITINGPSNYKLQIFVASKTHANAAKLLADQKELVRQSPFFSKVTEELPDGLKFESKIDSTLTYGFRRVRMMGDKEIIFREALLGTFSKEDIDRMYRSLDPKKK